MDRRLRPGDRGPRHADGVERRRPGRRQRQAPDVRRLPGHGGHDPGHGARRRAEREARADGRHLLLVRLLDPVRLLPHRRARRRRHVELVRRRRRRQRRHSTRRARRPTIIRRLRRPHDDAGLLDRQRRPGYGTDDGAVAGARDPGRRVDAVRRRPAGTRSRTSRQVADNDVVEWSNRGPGATGRAGVDVVADGAYAPGDATLNTVIDGRNAWETWGGTSRSTPVAVGATALVYQAYKAGARRRSPTQPTGQAILKSSANDLGYDARRRARARSTPARRSRPHAGIGARPSRPNEWRPATYRGTSTPRSSRSCSRRAAPTRSRSTSAAPGRGASPTACCEQRRRPRRSTFTSRAVSQRVGIELQRARLPDRTSRTEISAHPDADLMVDPGELPAEPSSTATRTTRRPGVAPARLQLDRRQPRRQALDGRRTATASSTTPTRPTSSNIDGFNDIDFAKSEIEQGEYVRFMYHRPGANTLMGFVARPGPAHGRRRLPRLPALDAERGDPETALQDPGRVLQERRLAVGDRRRQHRGRLASRDDQRAGRHAVRHVRGRDRRVERGSDTMVVPVVGRPSRATAPQDATRQHHRRARRSAARPSPHVADATSSTTTARSSARTTGRGGRSPVTGGSSTSTCRRRRRTGTLFLAERQWDDAGAVHGPRHADVRAVGERVPALQPDGRVGAPYILDTVGKSPNTEHRERHLERSTPRPAAATRHRRRAGAGGPARDRAAQVGFEGDKFNVPFKTTRRQRIGIPSRVDADDGHRTGSFDVTFKSSVDLPGFAAEAFGLSQPRTVTRRSTRTTRTTRPRRASRRTSRSTHASRATFTLDVGTDDVDLFIVYDANNDGNSPAARSSPRRPAAPARTRRSRSSARRTATTRSGCTASGRRHADGHRSASTSSRATT